MELEDLKPAWERLNARVQTLELELDEARHQQRLDQARSALRWRIAGRLVAIACWLGWVVTVAHFWVLHRDQVPLLVSGLVLHVYGVLGLLSGVLQLLLLTHVGYAGSVVELQVRLGRLAQLQALLSFALGIPWLWLWVPTALFAASWLADVNLYTASPAWVWANLALGTVAMLLGIGLARHWLRSPPKSARLRRAADLFSGQAFRRLRAEIATSRGAPTSAV